MKRNSSCRVSRKKTNISDEFLRNIRAANTLYKAGKNAYEITSFLGRGLKWLFSKTKDIDVEKGLESSKKMQAALLKKGFTKSDPLLKDFKKLDRTLKEIRYWDHEKQYHLKDYKTEIAKKLYKKLYKKFSQIMNGK